MILLNVLAGLNSLFKVMVKYFLGEANFDQVLLHTFYNSLRRIYEYVFCNMFFLVFESTLTQKCLHMYYLYILTKVKTKKSFD